MKTGLNPGENDARYTNMIAITTEKDLFSTRWQEISRCKEKFLADDADPRSFPEMNLEVAESWIRSRANGIDPYSKKLGKSLDPDQAKAVMEQNRLLIDTAIPLIAAFKPLLKSSGYMLTIHNDNGTILHIDGDTNEMSSFDTINVKVGHVWNETTVGTTAHGLSMHCKSPIQLLGPENYCNALQDNISSAAPIFDKNGNVISTLVLLQALRTLPLEQTLQSLWTHTLGWVTSMCVAIETQLQLKQHNMKLSLTNNTLDTTLSFIGQGIATIDKMNRITHANKKFSQMLDVNAAEIAQKNIAEIFGEQPLLQKALMQKLEKDFEISVGNKQFLASVKPILNLDHSQVEGAVIRIQDIYKVNELATRRFGASARYSFGSIIGDSSPMRKAKENAKKFAKTSDNILLVGESGTGKELFAQAIHNEHCPQGPFIAINCAALPRNLIESELFGYVGGTFTGADREGRPGKIELAHGGTLFLDEIGDMPFEIQAVLLRVLDSKKVMRIGDKQYRNVDFRLIAATHKNLPKMVEENQFRHDLYFRLSVLRIMIPPLRDRKNDILFLAEHLIQNYCQRMDRKKIGISPRAQTKILEYHWPGNVRQLESAIIYAINLAQDSGIIDFEHLPEEIINQDDRTADNTSPGDRDGSNSSLNKTMSLKEAEKIVIKNVLVQTGNNIELSAKLLEMGKSTLYRKLKEYNL